MKTKQIIILVALFLTMPVMAQLNANRQAIHTTFQSTSTLAGSGSAYSSAPMLNADGTAMLPSTSYSPYNTSTVSGPRKANAFDGEEDGDMPLGDGMWVMTVLAIVYAGWIARKRRKVNNE